VHVTPHRSRCLLTGRRREGSRGPVNGGANAAGEAATPLLHVSYPGQSVKSNTPWGIETVLVTGRRSIAGRAPYHGRRLRNPPNCSCLDAERSSHGVDAAALSSRSRLGFLPFVVARRKPAFTRRDRFNPEPCIKVEVVSRRNLGAKI